MELYPFCKDLVVESIVDKIPHRNMSLDAHLLYFKFAFAVLEAFPQEFEEKILSAVFKSLCQIDVEINVI